MKKVLIFIAAVCAAMSVDAAARSAQQALTIASDFTTPAGRFMAPARTMQQSDIVDSAKAYYAVNTRGGYVLVGADDRLPEVLGYNTSEGFDPENIAPALRFWLDCYEEELNEITNDQSPISNLQSRKAITAVNPLCTSKWNQGDPYNELAPNYNDNGGKCVTGCVATAMAQVMYYHKHPTMGTGSHSYTWICTNPVGKSGTLSANFGQTIYQWDNMIDNYRSGYTTEQANAVSTLMYHCGVSIDMGYGQSSGAYTERVPVALKNYFSYDANYQRIQKVMYPSDSLNAIIAAELKAKRPVIVSGHNDEGGHAFVCDGCDNKGYFHINWGWGGSNDGYYLLTALNPGSSQGIGGTTKGYNKGTCFFIGLQPAKSGTAKAIPQLATTNFTVSTTSVSRGTSFNVSISRLENFGMTDFSGSYGVALYDEDETKLVRVLKQVDNYSLSAGYHRTSAAEMTVSIPSSTSTVPNGTYHLCCVYKDANYGWMRMMCTEDDYFCTLEATSSTVTFYANDAEPELELTKAIAFPEGTNADSVPKTGIPVSFAVKNTGGTFRGQISARIYKGAFAKGQYEIIDSVVIRRNQTLSTALQQTFDAALTLNTQYKMKLCWRTDESDSWHNFDGELPFKLYDPDYHLSLTDTIHFDRNDSVLRSNANLYYSIKNTGAAFDGELQVSYYQGAFSRGKSEIRAVHIGTNETLEDAFSGPLDQEAGTYTVILRYRELNGDWKEFLDIYEHNIGSIEATIYDDTPIVVNYADAICEGSGYTGYGFVLSEDEMPAPGNNKELYRENKNAEGRDSLITLTLSVIAADTAQMQQVSIDNTQLPYVVDAYYTVPAEAPIGVPLDTVIWKSGCSYRRYPVIVNRCTTLSPVYVVSICEDQQEYNGYDFTITKDEMPAPGFTKEYSHTVRTALDCDSTTTLKLTVNKADTIEFKAEVLNNELPYRVGEQVIVPAGAAIGVQPAVLLKSGDCEYTKYIITVNRCMKESERIQDNICEDADGYYAYGFELAKADLPAANTYKIFERHETTSEGCDSTITLKLTVNKADTVDMTPVEVIVNQLPYVVDAFYTVPAEQGIGSFEAVVPNDQDCSYNRYRVTVKDIPTAIDPMTNDQLPITNKMIIDRQLLIIRDGKVYNAQGKYMYTYEE